MPPPETALVFAPSVTLTITVEGEAPGDQVHLHAGGQGFWVAQLMAELGAAVRMASPFGGETGVMLRAAIEQAGIGLRAVDMAAANGVSIHDRRGGDLEEIVDVPGSPLTRHEVDELYGAALVEALGARVCVLAGAAEPPVAAASLYERLTRDLRNNNRCVVADVAGPYLQAVVAGGVSVLKVSVEQLHDDGLVDDDSDAAVVNCAEELRAAGAGTVVVTRANQGLIAATDSGVFAARAPEVTVVEARGAGDSLTAGIATTLGRGGGLDEGVRVGTAAGVLNVTRRGLGTGSRREIEELARTVELRPLVRQE